jgi:hypothetical protein
VSGLLRLLLRSRQDMPEHPRYREGAKRDEREWIHGLSDRELAELCAELHAVDQAVETFRKPEPPEIGPLLDDPKKDAA